MVVVVVVVVVVVEVGIVVVVFAVAVVAEVVVVVVMAVMAGALESFPMCADVTSMWCVVCVQRQERAGDQGERRDVQDHLARVCGAE